MRTTAVCGSSAILFCFRLLQLVACFQQVGDSSSCQRIQKFHQVGKHTQRNLSCLQLPGVAAATAYHTSYRCLKNHSHHSYNCGHFFFDSFVKQDRCHLIYSLRNGLHLLPKSRITDHSQLKLNEYEKRIIIFCLFLQYIQHKEFKYTDISALCLLPCAVVIQLQGCAFLTCRQWRRSFYHSRCTKYQQTPLCPLCPFYWKRT